MKKYFYFGKDKNGAMVPIFECVSEEVPTPVQANTIYQEMSRQMALQGAPLGSVPRPTHYAAMDLHEIEQTDEVATEPLIVHARNGETVH